MKKTNNLYLVTGGAGFIGSHLVEKLINQGYEVLIIDDFTSGSIRNIPKSKKIRIINKKVQNIDIEELGLFNGIFHLAAQASVPFSIENFYESCENNLLSALKIFEWAKFQKVPVIYASSSAVYGNLSIGDESQKKYDILSPYAQDKLTLEHYASVFYKLHNIDSLGLRFFNVYGPRQNPENPYSGVISIFFDRILKKKEVTVNGGYQTRDFIFVKDVADVLYESMVKLSKKSFCDTLNVGTGVSISIDELLSIILDLVRASPKIIRKELPDGDPKISKGTYKKIKNILNINIDEFVDLKHGLNQTLQSFNKVS
jgi:UDP-glucose 4-epimerase